MESERCPEAPQPMTSRRAGGVAPIATPRGGAAAAAVAVLVLALAAPHLWKDLSQPNYCDTTYIRPGYAGVPLPAALAAAHPRYSLIRYADAEPSVAKAAAGAAARVPVLFVPGHLGSHEQMRSMASETGRELVRRAQAAAAGQAPRGAAPPWLDWHGAEFRAEPSALEGHLLEGQARFVAGCVRHLLGGGGGGRPAHHLIMVGYSMGGVVARAALRLLSQGPDAEPGRVALLLTLGSPGHHHPYLMPPPAAPDPGLGSRTAAFLAATPTLDVTAGPRDGLVPTVGPAALPHPAALAAPSLALAMGEVPGVWTAAGHKGIVSCNQLVRRTVPLMADVAELAVASRASRRQAEGVKEGQQGREPEQEGGAALSASQAGAVFQLIRRHMAMDVGRALAWAPGASQQPLEACVAGLAGPPPPEPTPAPLPLLSERLGPGRALSTSWDARQLAAAGHAGLLLLVSARQPCSGFRVTGVAAEGGGEEDHTLRAASLPPLLADLQPIIMSRHWLDVMAGVEWLGNATWLLHVPLGTLRSLRLDVAAGTAAATVLGQPTQGSPLDAGSALAHVLQPGFGSGRPLLLPAGHPAVMTVRAPGAWLPGAPPQPQPRLPLDWLWARQLALGSIAPVALHATSATCDLSMTTMPALLPAVVGRDVEGSGGDAALLLWGGAAQLWRPALAGRHVLLVTDPRCSLELSVRWDLLPWLAFSVRSHAFALPSLAIALALAQLGGFRGGAGLGSGLGLGLVCLAAVVGAEWAEAAEALLGLRPWARLSLAELLPLLALAAGAVAVAGAGAAAGRRALRRLGVADAFSRPAACYGAAAVAGGSTLAHPALPLVVGTAVLWWRSAGGGGLDPQQARRQLVGWHLVHLTLLPLPLSWLGGWLLGGRAYPYPWGLTRGLLALLGVHAGLLQPRPLQGWRAGAAVAASSGAAAATALAGLWGHPHPALYAVCACATARVLLQGWPGWVRKPRLLQPFSSASSS